MEWRVYETHVFGAFHRFRGRKKLPWNGKEKNADETVPSSNLFFFFCSSSSREEQGLGFLFQQGKGKWKRRKGNNISFVKKRRKF